MQTDFSVSDQNLRYFLLEKKDQIKASQGGPSARQNVVERDKELCKSYCWKSCQKFIFSDNFR